MRSSRQPPYHFTDDQITSHVAELVAWASSLCLTEIKLASSWALQPKYADITVGISNQLLVTRLRGDLSPGILTRSWERRWNRARSQVTTALNSSYEAAAQPIDRGLFTPLWRATDALFLPHAWTEACVAEMRTPILEVMALIAADRALPGVVEFVQLMADQWTGTFEDLLIAATATMTTPH